MLFWQSFYKAFMIHAPSGLQQMSIFTTAAQNHLSSSVVVFIKVLDINDNVPRLARDYQPYICEGTQSGEVCILWCTDSWFTVSQFGIENFHERGQWSYYYNPLDNSSVYKYIYNLFLFKYWRSHNESNDCCTALSFHNTYIILLPAGWDSVSYFWERKYEG